MSDPLLNITKAVRKGSHVLISLIGFSSSGKTYSALKMARGLAGPTGKICMIDTETGRGLIYANAIEGGYDYAELTPPYTPERYQAAIAQVENAGYDVLILDSGSHLWAGIGGILEMAEATNYSGLIKWAAPKARYKKAINSILNSKMHIIMCLRAKEKLEQITVERDGKKAKEIVSRGMVAIAEKGLIYEMTVQLWLPHEPPDARGTYQVQKCPADLLPAFPLNQKISELTGEMIRKWIDGGAPVDQAFEAIRRAGELAAEGGNEALDKWLKAREVRPFHGRLKPYASNFRSIAETADKEKAEAEKREAEPKNADVPDDPFAESAASKDA